MCPPECADVWGSDCVALRLPMCSVAMRGLSTKQRHAIARDHGSFVVADRASHEVFDVVCKAGRLSLPLLIDAGELTRAGQYTPRQTRKDDEIEVIGINFAARISSGSSSGVRVPGVASLCVAREEELPEPIVLENFLRILLAHEARKLGGMLLHSAGLVVDGSAFLFVGRSNAGKTTLSRKADAGGVQVLSDDINLVLPAEDGFAVHAVPFTGEFRRRIPVEPGAVPLGGILLLDKGPSLKLEPVGAATAVSALFAQSPFVNSSAEEAPFLLESLARLVAKVPVVRLTVSMENDFSTIMNAVKETLAHG